MPIKDNASQYFPLGEGGASQNVVKLPSHQPSDGVRPTVASFLLSLFLLNDPAITPPENGMFSTPVPSEPEDDSSSVEGILQVGMT